MLSNKLKNGVLTLPDIAKITTEDLIRNGLFFVPFLAVKSDKDLSLRERFGCKEEKEKKLEREYISSCNVLHLVLAKIGDNSKITLEDYKENIDDYRYCFIRIRCNSLLFFQTITFVDKEFLIRSRVLSPNNAIDYIAKRYNQMDKFLYNYLAYYEENKSKEGNKNVKF